MAGTPVADRVVDVATGRTLLDLGTMHIDSGTFGADDADGRPALVTAEDGNDHNALHLYDLRTDTEIGEYTPSAGAVLRVAVAPDGKRVAVTTSKGALIVFDVARMSESGSPDDAVAWSVKAHDGSVQGLAISAGGLLATSSSAGNVRLWSPTAGCSPICRSTGRRPHHRLRPRHEHALLRGRQRRDPPVRSRRQLEISRAHALVTRSFTADECARYFPHQQCPE